MLIQNDADLDDVDLDSTEIIPTESGSEERVQWTSRTEFILVTMGYAIGIGNLWRFPYLVGKYGGGAFLIPYFFSLIFVAAPLYLIEMTVGQYYQKGAVEAFRALHPKWVGLGYAGIFLVFLVSGYYQLLLVYAILFLGNSIRQPLPWAQYNGTTSYFQEYILHRTASISDEGSGEVQPMLVLGLFAVWVLIFFCLFKGIKGSGKVAYVTVTMPFLLLFIMVIKTVQLPGAGDGLIFYLKPRFDMLGNFDVWAIACGQILFSLSPGMGTAISLASYNPKTEDLYIDNLIVVFANSFFSLTGGVVVFSVVGYIAQKEGRDVAEVAGSGPGLAFVTFAEALSTFGEGWSQFFSVLFYLMLLSLGIDSSFAWVETLNTFIADALIARGIKNVRGELICLGMCITLFLIGILYTTRSGMFWLDIVDHYAGVYVLLFIVFFEYVLIGWVYGADRIVDHIKEMTGRELGKFWLIQPKWIGPFFVIILTLSSLIQNDILKVYENYPSGPTAFGWLCLIVSLSFIPICALKSHHDESKANVNGMMSME